MGLILVRAVGKAGYYPEVDPQGNKIPGSDQLRYPANEKSRGDKAGAPFWINSEDFSGVRKIKAADGGARSIGWMEEVESDEAVAPPVTMAMAHPVPAQSKKKGKTKIASEEEAAASPVPIPHVRTPKAIDEFGRPKRETARPQI
jgi:hypothetical protein